MFENKDIIDLINIFNRRGVEFILIGGYAIIYYTEPRYTKDIDFLVKADATNARAIIDSLVEFGIPEEYLKLERFAEKEQFFKFGKPPWRIDLITSVYGAEFDELYKRSQKIDLDHLFIPKDCISRWPYSTKKTCRP